MIKGNTPNCADTDKHNNPQAHLTTGFCNGPKRRSNGLLNTKMPRMAMKDIWNPASHNINGLHNSMMTAANASAFKGC